MKWLAILKLSFTVITISSFSAVAHQRTFGIGLMLFDPTGISAKMWLNNNHALNMALGWQFRWHHYNYYYTDSRCYNPDFYRTHVVYCNERYYPGPYYHEDNVHFHLDYLFHNFSAIKSSQKFGLYYGPGMILESWFRNILLGIRGNFGITWMPHNTPLDLFFELAPALFFIEFVDFDIDGGLGVRFWF